MNNSRAIMVAILLLSAIFFVTQSALTADKSVSAANATLITPVNSTGLVSFVESAVVYAKENGKEKALIEFNNKKGPFVKGELYIFAFDFNGTCLANVVRQDLVGENKLNLTDANGVLFTKNAINYVKNDDGFYYLVFPNPMHNNKNELKLSYAKNIDNDWLIGSGIYLSNISATFDQKDRDDLVAYVNEALKFAKENGKQKALEIFNNPKGNFKRDGRYIFAANYTGQALALPFQPELVGKKRLDAQDLNMVKFGSQVPNIARRGNGFYYVVYPDPSRNMMQRLKLEYVADVDGTWFIGSGIYVKGEET